MHMAASIIVMTLEAWLAERELSVFEVVSQMTMSFCNSTQSLLEKCHLENNEKCLVRKGFPMINPLYFSGTQPPGKKKNYGCLSRSAAPNSEAIIFFLLSFVLWPDIVRNWEIVLECSNSTPFPEAFSLDHLSRWNGPWTLVTWELLLSNWEK